MHVNVLQNISDRALAIKAAAEAEGRNFTQDEVTELEGLFQAFRVADQMLDQQPAPRRITQPDTRIGGSMPGETSDAYARMPEGERLIDSSGRELRVFGKGERLIDSIPRSQRLAPGDLGALVLGMASGDWSKVSDRCRQVMGQMGTTPDSAGGVLLPAPLSAEIISKMYDRSVWAQTGHRTVVIDTKALEYARVASSITPNWRAEHQVIRETYPALDSVQLTAKNLGAMTRSSVELLEDAPVASSLLSDLLAQELAQEYDRVMFDGAGSTIEPMGLLQAPGVQSIFWGTGLTSYFPFMQALGLLWAISVQPNAVVVSPQTRIKLATLPTGLTGDLQALPVPSELAALTWLMSPKVGNQGGSPTASSALIGDFTTAVVGLRQAVRIETSSEGGTYSEPGSPSEPGDAFARNQVRIKATMRCDLVLHQPSKIVRIVQIEG